jgi:ATP-dependent DNA helicase RecG
MSVVREALRNVFCHRLYEDLGAVQVDIFWNKVDIYSPGWFPLGSSPEDYLSDREDASRPRNPLIAATLYRSRDIEAYGTGLQRIKEACEAQGVPFEVTQRGGSMHVVFMRQEGITVRKDTAESADNPPTRQRLRRQPAEPGRKPRGDAWRLGGQDVG